MVELIVKFKPESGEFAVTANGKPVLGEVRGVVVTREGVAVEGPGGAILFAATAQASPDEAKTRAAVADYFARQEEE